MCIRDRLQQNRRAALDSIFDSHGAGDLEGHLRRVNFVEGAVDQLGLDAVSYTHLRAHETVLDLVCRLLLEQKTQ
mgnify:CR=1 FL=1